MIPAQPEAGSLALEAAVRLKDGTELRAPLGTIQIGSQSREATPARAGAAAGSAAEEPIAVCLATYEPDPALLAVQIQSLRDQTDNNWRCLISDGGSSAAGFARLLSVVGDDERFAVSPSTIRLDPYRNFERALSLVGPDTPLIALCDQDDRWYSDKLASLRAGLGEALLIYSDQRLVTEDGRVLASRSGQGGPTTG